MSESTASTASRIWAVDGFIDWPRPPGGGRRASGKCARHHLRSRRRPRRSPEGPEVGRLGPGAPAPSRTQPLLDDLLDEVGHPDLADPEPGRRMAPSSSYLRWRSI